MSDQEQDEERATRPFADVLQALQRGRTHRELSTALQDLTKAVVDTHRAGSLTLTLKVSRNKAGMIEVDDTVTVKPPKADRTTSLFYATDEANLVRDDPRQLELPTGPVRVAGSAPAAARVVSE